MLTTTRIAVGGGTWYLKCNIGLTISDSSAVNHASYIFPSEKFRASRMNYPGSVVPASSVKQSQGKHCLPRVGLTEDSRTTYF